MRDDTNGSRSRFLLLAFPCLLRLSPFLFLSVSSLYPPRCVCCDASPMLPIPSPPLPLDTSLNVALQYSCKNIHSPIPRLPTSTCCYEYCRIPSSSPNPQFHSLCLFLFSCTYALLCKLPFPDLCPQRSEELSSFFPLPLS